MVALLVTMLTSVYAFAQTSLGDSRDSQKNGLPTGVFFEFFGVAVVLALIIYAGYKYRRSRGAGNKHMPPISK